VTTSRKAIGDRGEKVAVAFLEKQGYRIIDTNVHLGSRRDGLPGELDIVAWDGDTLAFVEVKTRTVTGSNRDDSPAEAVTPMKQRQIANLALAYAGQNNLLDDDVPLRFDVIAVRRYTGRGEETCRCELIRSAFYPPEE
jgi:putative endonuclease